MKPSKRNLSDSKFKNRNSQCRHMKIVHEKLKPYHCQSCSSNFGKKGNLERHMKTKCLGKNDTKKIENSKSRTENTFTAKNKKYHSKILKGPSKFCQICNLKFTNKSDLAAHFQAVHKLNNNPCKRPQKEGRKNKTTKQFIVDNLCLPKSYLCDICDESSSNARTFEVHFQQIHNSTMAFACDVCFERFPKEATLSQHKKSCTN